MQVLLKERISFWKEVPTNQLYLSNGSDEFISQIIMGCCEPGIDHIVIVPPTFGMYKVAARTYGVGVKEVPLTIDFQLNVAAILASVNEHSKLIFIPTPNNPTGNSFKEDDIKEIIEGFDGFVIIDEAYVEFTKASSVIPWLIDHSNLIVCQTFSKAQGMAGSRLGMAFAHSELIHFLNKIKAPYNINSLTINKALQRIDEQSMVAEQVSKILSERKRLEISLSKIDLVKKCYPSDANFLLVKVDDSTLRYKQLLEHRIIVRNSSKNMGCENTLRISVGLPEENDTLIKVLINLDR